MDNDYVVTEETVDGLRVTYWQDVEGGSDPVEDYDHVGTLYAWPAGYWSRDVGPHDGHGARGRARDAVGYVSADDPDGWARETAAEVSAAGGVVIPVAYHDYGSSGARFGPVDDIDNANGLLVIDAATVDAEWSGRFADGTDPRERARTYGYAFIGEVGAWVAGEVYGYTVTTPAGDVVGGCGGFIGADPWKADDWMRSDARAEAAAIAADLARDVASPDLTVALAAARQLAGER